MADVTTSPAGEGVVGCPRYRTRVVETSFSSTFLNTEGPLLRVTSPLGPSRVGKDQGDSSPCLARGPSHTSHYPSPQGPQQRPSTTQVEWNLHQLVQGRVVIYRGFGVVFPPHPTGDFTLLVTS